MELTSIKSYFGLFLNLNMKIAVSFLKTFLKEGMDRKLVTRLLPRFHITNMIWIISSIEKVNQVRGLNMIGLFTESYFRVCQGILCKLAVKVLASLRSFLLYVTFSKFDIHTFCHRGKLSIWNFFKAFQFGWVRNMDYTFFYKQSKI